MFCLFTTVDCIIRKYYNVLLFYVVKSTTSCSEYFVIFLAKYWTNFTKFLPEVFLTNVLRFKPSCDTKIISLKTHVENACGNKALDVTHLNCRSDTFLRDRLRRRRRVDLGQEELRLEDVAPLVQRRQALVDGWRGVGTRAPVWTPGVLDLVRAEEVICVDIVLGRTNHLK